ncbi:hypothetical protein Za10_1280 [Zymomonas mobilis subsp. mobilis NCIMB 11163]|uniref:DUF2726 domain-containing protein n=1 Tax=Zymomonas mobilis TaxID=542 RepID=UPI0001B70617|nr:DUF2726 domain-containing protein [Zymomonas mobilis]ACV75823.1 hypothetical protein Za10_1280 [Zymomonas mobilis subsp. mobilis NCIMB 11163]
MEKVIILLAIGYALGFYIRGRRATADLAQAGQQIAERNARLQTLDRQISGRDTEVSSLRRRIATLETQAADQKKEAESRRQYFQDNDLSNTQNQLHFISQCSLRAVRPVNKEAVQVLYALDEWIRTYQPDWRFAFEVSMGGFIRTTYDPEDPRQKQAFSSYSGKRVDFLLIDRYGLPVMVIEYHGTGHDLSGDADDRMAVKRLALQKASIPLLEIPEKMARLQIMAAISEAAGAALKVKTG